MLGLLIGFIGGLVYLFGQNIKLQKKLNMALKTTYTTPIKELVSDFRDFVEGIDGKISPEVDTALKKLETNEIKQLPPKTKISKYLKGEKWNIFIVEYNACDFDDTKIKIIKSWGKKYKIGTQAQAKLMGSVDFDDTRIKLREYFDQFHNNNEEG